MKIDRIKATNIEMTDAIRTAVETELASLDAMTERFGEAVSADVEVGRTTSHHHKGEVFRAEINLTIPGKLLRAEAEREDLYVAIRDVVKEMHREVKDEKDRHDDAKHVADAE